MAFRTQGALDIGHVSEYLGTLSSSLGPPGYPRPQSFWCLPTSTLGLSQVWPWEQMAEADGCLSGERRKRHTRIHRAGCQLTVHFQDVQLLVQEGLWAQKGKAGGGRVGQLQSKQ